MSRFFRSPDSSSSSSEGDDQEDNLEPGDDETEHLSQPIATAEPSIVNRPSADRNNHHRDFMLHALLEERCMNEVLASYPSEQRRPSRDVPQIQAEAKARYQRLCAQLASYNLISTGLEGDHHAVTRQKYREGLDFLGQHRTTAGAVPPQLRRLLTNSGVDDGVTTIDQSHAFGSRGSETSVPSIALPLPLRKPISDTAHAEKDDVLNLTRTFTNTLGQQNPTSSVLRSRYYDDFEEISVLGRGGYGVVHHVRHRLDNQAYAVKKIPLSTARLHRIQKRGEPEVQDVLRELRTLARLDHPNIVRYYNGWIEWVVGTASPSLVYFGASSRIMNKDSQDASLGAEQSQIGERARIATESSSEGISGGVVFETSAPGPVQPQWDISTTGSEPTADRRHELSQIGTKSKSATVRGETAESIDREIEPSDSFQSMQSGASGIHFTETTLAIHVQMSLSAMTLADFIAPPVAGDAHTAPPLTHCFHLEPSICFLLAVLDGLDYLHNEGIIHRDIKPANIFLGLSSNARPTPGSVDLMSCTDCRTHERLNPIRLEVRIGDFGLVSVVNPDADAAQASEAAGTVIYRPPGLAAQRPHPSLDIYALGIVAFELLWKFNTRMERFHTLQQLKQGEFPAGFEQVFAGNTGRAMKGCIRSMLAQDGNSIAIPELKHKLEKAGAM